MALLIDIEGIDGSGKGSQSQRLCERLKKSGVSAQLLSFPRYDATFFGGAVGEFLNGRFGNLAEVHPFLVSLLFAGDRFESKGVLDAALHANQVVVLDRYVPSNVAHQASKLTGAAREDLTQRILHLEFEIYGLPRPHLVVLLDLPIKTAQELIAKKAARSYTTRAADIQEADGDYLQRVREVYLDLAKSEPDWNIVRCCTRDGMLRTMDDIGDELWKLVQREITTRRV